MKDDFAKRVLDNSRVNFAISERGPVEIDHVGIRAESADEPQTLSCRPSSPLAKRRPTARMRRRRAPGRPAAGRKPPARRKKLLSLMDTGKAVAALAHPGRLEVFRLLV